MNIDVDYQVIGFVALAFVCWLALFALAMNRVKYIRPRRQIRCKGVYRIDPK